MLEIEYRLDWDAIFRRENCLRQHRDDRGFYGGAAPGLCCGRASPGGLCVILGGLDPDIHNAPFFCEHPDRRSRIYLTATDGPPRALDNNTGHGDLRDDSLYDAHGAPIRSIAGEALQKTRLTPVLNGDPRGNSRTHTDCDADIVGLIEPQ